MKAARSSLACVGGPQALGLWSVLALPLLAPSAHATEPAAAPTAPPTASPAKPGAGAAKPAPAPSKPAPAPAHPESCEVELTGQILGPLAPGMTYWVYVAEGDCLAKNAKILGAMRGSEAGSFGIEVFSSWGANLTVCASVAKTPESPTKLYGKLPRVLRAEATGEVMFERLQIKLKPGPEHSFPKAIRGS